MPTTYDYPTAEELTMIAQEKVPLLTQDDPIFKLFPFRDKNVSNIVWEQRDNFRGLQQLRGVNGEPARVKNIGGKQYNYVPGIYGEFMSVDEQEMLERRPWGGSGIVDLTDLVIERQEQLLSRRIERIRSILWTLLATGTFSVSLPTGGIAHTDTYTQLTASAAVDWDTSATATPLVDFRAITLLSRGTSSNFARGATAFMNRSTFNKMIANTNANDLGGYRAQGLLGLMSNEDIQRVFIAQDLPEIVIYDEGYYNDSGVWTLLLPTDKVIIVGTRPGSDPVGEYWMTRNIVNEGFAAGAYQKTIERMSDRIPPIVEVHDGHNGGPVLFYPGAIVRLSV